MIHFCSKQEEGIDKKTKDKKAPVKSVSVLTLVSINVVVVKYLFRKHAFVCLLAAAAVSNLS